MILLKRKTYENVIYEWLETKKNKIKESTYHQYLIRIEKYIAPILGDIPFKRIKPKDIEEFFETEEILALSSTTKENMHIMINSSIKYGVEKKYRKKFKELEIKFKHDKNEITYFTKKEQRIIEKYLNKNMNIRNLAILVSLYTGMRIGELCALTGNDIDYINNTITINKTVQRIKYENDSNKTKLAIDVPKTKNSLRTIPVPEFVIKNLKAHIKDNNNFIFTGSNKPKDPRALEKYFKTVLKKVNLKQMNYHSLRHTYATRLKEQKVDIKVISELLGHSTWKITQDIYVHASFESKRQSVNSLKNVREKQ